MVLPRPLQVRRGLVLVCQSRINKVACSKGTNDASPMRAWRYYQVLFFRCRFAALLSDQSLFTCIIDGLADAVEVNLGFVWLELAG